MKFEEIENLDDREINELYEDIVEFGDEGVAGCCCANFVKFDASHYNYDRAHCIYWCRGISSFCLGWGYNWKFSC